MIMIYFASRHCKVMSVKS
ncbi:UNVERIFIED_CONTAM: hypothetical protein GTU68_023147 [Idotea baltica]|nr:hypothetical protein [Idotea baltica]